MRFCVILGLATDSVTLMFVPDREKKLPALAHGRGLAFSHIERVLPFTLRDDVLAIGRALAQNVNTKGTIIEFVRHILDERRSNARILRALPLPSSHLFPRVSGAKRSGVALEGEVFPFDAELIGLEAGLRRLIKRDGLISTEVAEVSQTFVRRGLVVREGREGDGRTVLFAAKNEDTLQEAIFWEAQIDARGENAPEAAMAFGRALGYPDCCVSTFARLPAHDDLALALALLPESQSQPASPYSLWLAPTLALISHAPCSLDCTPTITLGKDLCAALDAERPGFARNWQGLARRLVVLVATGKIYAMSLEGHEIIDVIEAGADGILRPAVQWKRMGGDWIEAETGERIGVSFRADHRAA